MELLDDDVWTPFLPVLLLEVPLEFTDVAAGALLLVTEPCVVEADPPEDP